MVYRTCLKFAMFMFSMAGMASLHGSQTEEKVSSEQEKSTDEQKKWAKNLVNIIQRARGDDSIFGRKEDLASVIKYLHGLRSEAATIINTPTELSIKHPHPHRKDQILISMTPFQWSLQTLQSSDVIKLLLDRGADVDMPLMFTWGYLQHPLDLLAGRIFDATAYPSSGKAIHLVELLIEYGAQKSYSPRLFLSIPYLRDLLRLAGVIPSNFEELKSAVWTINHEGKRVQTFRILRSRMKRMNKEETLNDLFILALEGDAKAQKQYEKALQKEEIWQKHRQNESRFNQKYSERVKESAMLGEVDPKATSQLPMSGCLSDRIIDSEEKSACTALEFMKTLSDENSAQEKQKSESE